MIWMISQTNYPNLRLKQVSVYYSQFAKNKLVIVGRWLYFTFT